jgi:undecaprenyl-phosphate 4-deoxy-4-formamido-L-arabinose transferase
MPAAPPTQHRTHLISVVIPVYAGRTTLPQVVAELAEYTNDFRTEDGHLARVSELFLVHDHGPDGSDETIRELVRQYDFVRPVWLSRNFGQHAATLAGMSSSGGDWVVTMDEDGQHDPAYLGALLDRAMAEQAAVVYASPTNKPPHGPLRNTASKGAKWLVERLTGNSGANLYHSYRLVLGEVARGLAAYAGAGVYLDVALGWVAGGVTSCPLPMREEGDRRSGYRLRSLMSHFWRLVLTSGTRLLRVVSMMGAAFSLIGVVAAVVLVISRLVGDISVPGWTSVMVFVIVGTGAVLFSLGIVAEYLGVAVNMAMGKPLYLITTDPQRGPLGRRPAHGADAGQDAPGPRVSEGA